MIRDHEWPDPAPDPEHELADPHRPPLDDDEDGRWLRPEDERRLNAERRRGRRFDEDEDR